MLTRVLFDIFIDALLTANQELVLALSAHTQMMDTRNKVRLARAGHKSTTTNNAQPQTDLSPDTTIHDLLVFREPSRSTSGSASSSRSASPKMSHQTIDPFADQSYYVSGPTDVASIVKQGYAEIPGYRGNQFTGIPSCITILTSFWFLTIFLLLERNPSPRMPLSQTSSFGKRRRSASTSANCRTNPWCRSPSHHRPLHRRPALK